MGFVVSGDVLVLDNSQIHPGKENDVLEDWLCERFANIILWLPTQSPELNPIELVWNTLVTQMKTVPLQIC